MERRYGDLERGDVLIGGQERVLKQDTPLSWRCYQGRSLEASGTDAASERELRNALKSIIDLVF